MSDDEVYWEFARAEVDSSRYGGYLRPRLTTSIIGAIRRDERGALSASDWNTLKVAVWELRSPILVHIVDRGFTWEYVDFPTADLTNVLFLRMAGFASSSPNRTIGELLHAIKAGNPPTDASWLNNFQAMSRAFAPSAIKGAPVFVTDDQRSQYLIMEGLTRSTCYWKYESESKLVKHSARILVGTTSNLDRLLRLSFA